MLKPTLESPPLVKYVFPIIDYLHTLNAEQALGQSRLSKVAWQKALEALPSDNLTEGEMTQKKQYEVKLAAVSLGQLV